MLMLQRASGLDNPDEECDAMAKLICNADPENALCPEACRPSKEDNNNPDEEVVVKAGDLAVTASAAAGRKAIINSVSDLDTLKFKTSEKVTISKVILERYGYSKGTDVEKVWLEDEDGNIISSEASVNSRDQVSLSIKKDYRDVDGSFNATIVAKLASGDVVTPNGTVGFKVVNAESTAENLNLDDYTPYEYEMVGYEAASDVTVDAKGSDKTFNYEEGVMYEVAKMKVKAGASAITINGFTLKNAGDLDLEDFLDEVKVTVDDETVEGVSYSVNKEGNLNIAFDSVDLAAKSSVVFAVTISLADFDEYGEDVKLQLAANTDFKATEKKTGARIYPTIAGDWAKYVFAGSKVKLSNTKLGNLEYAQGSTDVVVSEGKITLAEPVEKIGKANPFVVTGTYTTGADIIEEMRLLIAGEEYLATKSYTSGATVATFTFPEMEIEQSGKYQVVVDLDAYAPAGAVVTFEGTFDDVIFSGAEYSESNKSDVNPDEISGIISFATKLTVQAGKASFTNSLTKAVEFKDNDVNTKTVFDGTYTAKKNDANLTDFVVAGEALPAGVSITFYLYVDGKEVADTRIKTAGTGGSDSISNVKVAAGESVDIRVDAEVSAKKALTGAFSGGDLGKFAITLNGEDDNNNPITTSAKNTVQMKVVEAGSVKITDASASKAKDVALRGSEAKLAQFTVKSSNSSDVEFETFVFSGTYNNGASGYVAEDLVVTLGNTELECSDVAAGISCDVYENISAAGATVTIALSDTDKAAGNVVINVTNLNGPALSTAKSFAKRFVDAVVRIEKQEFKKATTVFTLSLETADDDVEDPVGLALYSMSGSECTNEIYSNTGISLEDGKTITLQNGETAALICGVKYGYSGSNYVYEITSAEEDYFKLIPTTYVNGTSSNDDLMISNVD